MAPRPHGAPVRTLLLRSTPLLRGSSQLGWTQLPSPGATQQEMQVLSVIRPRRSVQVQARGGQGRKRLKGAGGRWRQTSLCLMRPARPSASTSGFEERGDWGKVKQTPHHRARISSHEGLTPSALLPTRAEAATGGLGADEFHVQWGKGSVHRPPWL